MMKKILLLFLLLWNVRWQCTIIWSNPLECLKKSNTITQIISPEIASEADPVGKWAQVVAQKTNIYGRDITPWWSTKENTALILPKVKWLIDYIIGFLWTIAVIYLIYNWFLLLLDPDDDQLKKLTSRIINIARAISGIGLSWIIVSVIFWIVWLFTWT